MELRQIKELMNAMGRSDISKLALKDGEFELTLERGAEGKERVIEHHVATPSHLGTVSRLPGVLPSDLPVHAGNLSSSTVQQPQAIEEKTSPQESNNHAAEVENRYITSPMVGTFYMAPSPEEPSFVKVGDTVDEDTVVCIVEAMKVMNEVKAGLKGVIVEILLDNSNPVEFGSKIFRIE